MDWNERVSHVFGSLNATLKPVSDPLLKEDPRDDEFDTDKSSSNKSKPGRSRQDQSRDRSRDITRSHFKKPMCSMRGSASSKITPRYVTEPQKWKKYDLTFDGTEDRRYRGLTSDQINTKIALEYLSKRNRQLNEKIEKDREEMSKCHDKMIFKKPSKLKDRNDKLKDCNDDECVTQQSSLVNDDNVLAAVKDKDVICETQRFINPPLSKVIRLSHLEDEEEEL
jgi:hypothetical protein